MLRSGQCEFWHPEPLYNTVHYNTVLDITRVRVPSSSIIKRFWFSKIKESRGIDFMELIAPLMSF